MADKSLEDYSPEEVASMAATYNSLLNNPATRETVLRATKHINPGISIPEVDLKDATRGAFKTVTERMDLMQADQLRRDTEARVERERSNLRGQGFGDDDIAEIEKMMVREQIPNYGTAAKHYKNSRQIAEATPSVGPGQSATSYELPKDAMTAMKGGKAGLSKFAREQASAALNDLQSGRIKLH